MLKLSLINILYKKLKGICKCNLNQVKIIKIINNQQK